MKDRTIVSVAASYDLVPQTVGNWGAKHKKEHMSQADEKDAAESAEIRRLRAQLHERRQANELLGRVAWLAQEQR